tara:strand:- start:3080 stop:3472 length:393 start_codon:yes stop_codon:yes gene_type:complete
MPKIHLDPTLKGIEIKEKNAGVDAKFVQGDTRVRSSLQTLSGNGETITVLDKGMVIRIDAGGGARTGTILQQGSVDGQIIILVNVGGEKITMAAAGTSNVASGTGCAIDTGTSYLCVYDSTVGDWFPAET